MAQDSARMGPRSAKMAPRGTEKGQDSRKTAKNKKGLISVPPFFAEGPRETLVFSKKKTSQPPAARSFQGPGEGVGGGVNPSPEGERGVVNRFKRVKRDRF